MRLLRNTVEIDKLHEGDCFLVENEEATEREQLRLEQFAALHGVELTAKARDEHFRQYLIPHIVTAVAVKTGDRCSQRVTDSKRFIWCAKKGTQVEYINKRDEFERRLVEMAAERKKFDDEISKAKKLPRSKKKNKASELEVRTLVSAK